MSNYLEPRHHFRNEVDYTRLGIEKSQCTLTGETIQERKRKLMEKKRMEIPIKEHKVIPAGQHDGVILKVDYRTTPLEYTDYHIAIEVNGERVTVKASYPTNITPETIHGRMLARFGLQIVANMTANPDKLIGIKCRFQLVNKTTLKGTFPEVMRDTLIPLPVAPAPAPAGIPVGQPAQATAITQG